MIQRTTGLNRWLLVAAVVAASVVCGPLSADGQAPIQRAGGTKLKISLNAYSFNKMLADHLKDSGKGMSLLKLLDFCAEHNFDAIDPTGYYFPGYPKVPSADFVNEFKRRAFVLGLDISGTGVRTHFASADKAKREKDIQHVKEWVEVAARMGAPVLRVFAGAHPQGFTWDEVAEWMVADLKVCAEHGRKHGVIIGIQNHDDFLKTGEQTVKIVKMVDSEWFGVVVDTGAFATDDPYKDIAMVAPFAVNWQIKTHMPGKGGKVKSDFKKIVQIARQAGYRGYVPIETLPVAGEPYDPLVRVPSALEELRSALDSPQQPSTTSGEGDSPAARRGRSSLAQAARNVRQIIAHRGSSSDRPENTLASYRRAIEAGATATECDVRTTKDGVLVSLHDADVARTSNGKGKLPDLTLEELRRWDFGSWFNPKFKEERIPTIEEILILCRDRIDVMLDLKEFGEDYADRVARLVHKFGQPKRTIVGVRSAEQARQFRKRLPQSRQIGLIPTPKDIADFSDAGVETIRIWPKWLGDATIVGEVRRHKKQLHLSATKGTKEDVLPLLLHEPESLSSDDPAELIRTLRDIGKR